MNRMRMACVCGLAVMFCLAARAMADAPPEGFEALFDGKDLSNFKASEEQKKHWIIKDNGVLEFSPVGKKGEMTMWTKKEYGELVMMIDPATGEEKKDANGKVMSEEVLEYDSGVYLRGNSKSQVNMWNWPCGSGEVYGYRTDKNQPQEVRAGVTPKKKMDKPNGEWNHMVITMKGDRLTVELNGEEVISNAQLPKVPAKGAIALQDHGEGFELRNIYIKELK